MFVKAPNSCGVLFLLHRPFFLLHHSFTSSSIPPSFVSWWMFIEGFQSRGVLFTSCCSIIFWTSSSPVSLCSPSLLLIKFHSPCLHAVINVHHRSCLLNSLLLSMLVILPVYPSPFLVGCEIQLLVLFIEFLLNPESYSFHIVWLRKNKTKINLQQI